jgi:sec-independent protein translocase protein TatB
MFDFSMGEIVVIGAVALIVIGPKELPGVLRAVGHWTTKVRRMASEFQGQFQEAMREAEMADLKKEVDTLTDTAKGFTSQFDDPLNVKEATKWESKAEETKPADDTKPADAAPTESGSVTPDGYVAPEAARPSASEQHVERHVERPLAVAGDPAQPHPAAEDATPANTPVPAGSGHQDVAGNASGGVHS